VVERAAVHTIADGIAVRVPVPEAVADMHGTVDEVLLVSEDAIERAMRLTFQHAGLVVEPAGVVGIAALLDHPALRGGRAATVLCGSNLTADQVARWLT
jgi:threonine dehydratase